MKRTTQFIGCSRGYIYDQAAKGNIDIFKSGPAQNSLIVVGTVSILKLMAAMRRAAIKPRRLVDRARKSGDPTAAAPAPIAPEEATSVT
jgi:hypothetical protein